MKFDKTIVRKKFEKVDREWNKQVGKKQGNPKKLKEILMRVLVMRRQFKSNAEIADETGLNIGNVSAYVLMLKKQGFEIPSQKWKVTRVVSEFAKENEQLLKNK